MHPFGDAVDQLRDQRGRTIGQVLLQSFARRALRFSAGEVTDIFCRSLNLDAIESATLVDFLTWSPSVNNGIWGAAAHVPVPETEQLAIARNVLVTSNLRSLGGDLAHAWRVG